MARTCNPTGKRFQAGELWRAGKTVEEIAVTVGVCLETACNYTRGLPDNGTRVLANNVKKLGTERCKCGLLLPCFHPPFDVFLSRGTDFGEEQTVRFP